MSSQPNLLENVPDELVDKIVKFVYPFKGVGLHVAYSTRRDLINLCLTSKRFRRFALVCLYSRVEIEGTRLLHKFMRSIVRNPSLGILMRSLRLEQWLGDAEFGEIVRKDDDGDAEERKRRYQFELAEFSKAASALGIDPDIVKNVNRGSESAIALILLHYLPNLASLVIQPPFWKRNFQKFTMQSGGDFLINLKMITYSPSDGRLVYPLSVLVPFFFLLSIRIISASRTYGKREDLELQSHYRRSSVQTLNLHNSNVDRHTFTQLIQLPSSLKNLHYGRTSKGFSTSPGSTRREFAEDISLVSHSLECLYISWSHFDRHVEPDDKSFFGSLAHFRTLKKLSVGIADFLGESPDSSPDSKLVEFLPPDLEELQLPEPPFDSLGWKHWDKENMLKFYSTCYL